MKTLQVFFQQMLQKKKKKETNSKSFQHTFFTSNPKTILKNL